MKNNKLKVCFAIALSFAMCSLKAQSLQRNFQKDMEQRKKHTEAVRMKAKEQQEQQKAERTTTTIDNKPATGANQNQSGNTNTSAQTAQPVPVIKPSPGSMRPGKKPVASRG